MPRRAVIRASRGSFRRTWRAWGGRWGVSDRARSWYGTAGARSRRRWSTVLAHDAARRNPVGGGLAVRSIADTAVAGALFRPGHLLLVPGCALRRAAGFAMAGCR